MQDKKKKFRLEKFDCFSVTGKDARKFLNGITTSNILNSENNVIKTCWLTPNGVLRSLIEINFLSFFTRFQCAKRLEASRIRKGLINSDGCRRK